MRLPLLFALLGVIFAIFPDPLEAQSVSGTVFVNNLTIGSTGQEVLLLQELLNRDPETQIAVTGSGSRGNETAYFGALTKAAVIRFQNKYAGDVLVPVGLYAGSGYVGLYTRAKLELLFAQNTSSPPASPPQALNSPGASMPTPPTQNPSPAQAQWGSNSQNLSTVLDDIETVGKAQGLSAEKIAAAKAFVTKSAATSTDLNAAFANVLKNTSSQAAGGAAPSSNALSFLKNALADIFFPHALAQTASPTGIPFGGQLLLAVPCDGGVWNLYLRPLPPSYVVILSYLPFTQLYSYYNLNTPIEGISLLGKYLAGTGACFEGVVFNPAQGTITPEVGSSLTPMSIN